MGVSRDIRTLCDSCRAEYIEAGYYLRKIWVKNKEECDRCLVKMGWTYELLDHPCSLDGESGDSYQVSGREFKSRRG